MSLEKDLLNFLKRYKKTRILLDELEKQCDGQVEIIEFDQLIIALEHQGILSPVKSSKTTIRNSSLYHKYNIHKSLLHYEMSQEIQRAQRKWQYVNLSKYYELTELQWEADRPYIEKIQEYLLYQELPGHEVLGTELSFLLVGDEKWIDEGSGKLVLERLNLWDQIRIQKYPDPLMMAVDLTKKILGGEKSIYYHLIVENKGTYYALLDELPNTIFTTLIYGQGWKIIANINQLERQLMGIEGDHANSKTQHKIFYFGDLDYEGITIWYKLNQIRPIHLAIPFYKELLKQKESKASKNQTRQEVALQKFLCFFPKEKERISTLFDKGGYYPQEAITEKELRRLVIQLWNRNIGGVSNDQYGI